MINIIKYLTLGFRDLFDRRVILVAIFPFILTFILFAAEIAWALYQVLPWLDELLKHAVTVDPNSSGWLNTMFSWMNQDLVYKIIEVLMGIALFSFLMIINVFLAILLIGVFFTEQLIEKVNKTHYHLQLEPFADWPEIISFSLKALAKFLLVFILLSPLYFFPIVNVLALAIPSFFYLKKTVVFDVASQSTTRENYQKILTENRLFLSLLTIPLYLLLYVPIINIFSYIYAFLVMTHFFLDRLSIMENPSQQLNAGKKKLEISEAS